MQKKFTRIMACLLVLVMIVGILAALPASAEEPTYTAGLSYVDANWAYQTWGTDATCEVSGPGTYTLSLDIPAESVANGPLTGATVILIDIGVEGGDAADVLGKYTLCNVKMTLDGNEVAIDQSKVQSGNMEEKGRFRIDLYNEWGDATTGTKANPCLSTADISFSQNMTIEFTLAEVSYVAAMGLVASDWSTSTDFREASSVQTVVTGDGTYTLSYDGACKDLGILVVDIVGCQADLLAKNKTWQVSDVALTIDGNAIAVDASKILSGDLEENGNFRIDLHNMYGATNEASAVDATVAVASNLTLTFTLTTVDLAPADPQPEPEPVPEFDPAGSYNAYLLLQTPNWTYRNAWNDTNGGLGSEFWGNYIYGNETSLTYGVVTDAVVAGNGTYSVMITDFGTIFADDFATAGQDYFNILGVSTDIPLSDDLVITDVHLVIDGKTKVKYAEAYLDPDDTDYVKILVQNIWNADVASTSYYPVPEESLEIRFTIKSGFNYDKAGSEEPDPTTPATTPTTQPGGSTEQPSSPFVPIIIAVVAVVAVVVVIVVLKKKKAQ